MCYEGYSWYRKHFTLPNAYNGRKIFLEFEGANVTADIWVNGTYMTTHYGGFLPFTVDITSVANYGATENVIAVKLDNYNDSDTPGAAGWSVFGGIYRDVWAHITDKLHVTDAVDANTTAKGGIFATFSNVSSSTATIDVNTHVENEYASAKTTRVITYLYDPNGDPVDANTSGAQSIAASGTYTFKQSFTISDPCLWTPETPYLYTVKTQVHNDDSNTVADRVDTAIGIKTVSFADGTGFKLNNVSRKFRGANRTQDWPFIGMAMSNFGQRTEAIKMKKAGHEYVRTAHYAQDPAFLNACDEYGIMVMDSIPTSEHYWGGTTFENRSYQQMKDMIRRDRNHAGIITWELSLNETWTTTEYDANAVNIGHTEYPGSYISGWKSDTLYDVYITTPHNPPGRDYSGTAGLIISEYGHFGFGGATSSSDVYRSSGEAAMLQ
jgi:beta-galactosidase